MATYRHQLMTIDAAARKYGIRPADLWGVYGVETSYGRNVNTSSAGAVGPFQFLLGTARSLGVNPYNFTSAAFGAAKYLASLGYSKDRRRALGAYNGGPGNPQFGYADQAIRAGHNWPGNPAGRAPARGKAPAKGGSMGSGAAQTIITGSTPAVPGGTPKADEIAGLQQQQMQPGTVPVTAPAEPAYGASRFMAPVGGPLHLTPPLAGGVTRPSVPSLAQQLADVSKQQGPALGSLTTETLPGAPLPSGGRGGRGAPSRGRFAGSYQLAAGAGRNPNGAVQAALKFASSRIGKAIQVGTTTNHSALTTYGTPSWHVTGNAADILIGGHPTALGDMIAASLLQYAGVPEAQAWRMARSRVEFYGSHGGRQFQILYRTPAGGGHFNHIHVGVK